jgi:hypothetical protein
VCPVIALDQFWGEHLFLELPGVVSRGITFPLDQILESPCSPKVAMSHDRFDFELRFSVNYFRGWSEVIGPVFQRFFVWSQE